MIDVFEQKYPVNLSNTELKTISIALENLPEDDKELKEVIKLYNLKRQKLYIMDDESPSESFVKSIKSVREILLQRFEFFKLNFQKEVREELEPIMLKVLGKDETDKILEKYVTDDEYEEI